MLDAGKTFLITTNEWFFAPDGEQYKAAFGTVAGVFSDQESLGIKTNRGSTNWYVIIGNLLIAGCQIHYAIRTDSVDFSPPDREIEHDGELVVEKNPRSRIYHADV